MATKISAKQIDQEMYELEQVLKEERHKLQVETFATISGIRGEQFGKEIFSAIIKFKDLRSFIDSFSEVQRNLNGRKVSSIRNYILSGLETENPMRFFPAITCTARGHLFYDEKNLRLAVDTKNSKLSINDGQHRLFGVSESIRFLEGKINTTKDKEEKEFLMEKLKQLNEMMMPVVVFNNLSLEEEKQLFTDTNNLSQRPSRSATIRLAQTDLYARMSREISEMNRYFSYFGVEMDKTSIFGNNSNTVLLTTIYTGIKFLAKKLDNKNYLAMRSVLNETFDEIFLNLPPDLNERGKYITDQNYTLKAIAQFVAECREKGIEEKLIFEAIAKVDWRNDYEYWKDFGAMLSKTGKLVFGGSGEHGKYAVRDALKSFLPRELGQMELLDDIEGTQVL